MGKVVVGMTISLDGFVNDRNGSVQRLYADMEALQESETLQQAMHDTGAVVMGRRAYNMAQGDFTGYEFQTPIFVLTHHPPAQAAKGENEKLKFTFVTDGIESAVKQAKAAAGDRDVTVVGGANTAQQCIQAGLVDELQFDIIPVLLGDGLRFFDNLPDAPIEFETTHVSESPGRIHLKFRSIK